MLTFPLAIIQSIGAIYLVRQSAQQVGGIGDITANTSLMQWVLMVAALTGGAMILMWLGELITEQRCGKWYFTTYYRGYCQHLAGNNFSSRVIGIV